MDMISSGVLQQSEDKGIRPELEFVFPTLVELRMDVDDLRGEFRAYKDREDVVGGPIPVAVDSDAYDLEEGEIELGIRPSERDDEASWGSDAEVKLMAKPNVMYSSGVTLEELERKAIAAALLEFNGNRRKAAQSLAIGERTLYRKIKSYGL